MPYKFWILKVFFYTCISIVIAISTNLLIDPYQIYKKHDFGFLANERYQIAGLINTYLNNQDTNYDTIIVGTSMSQNFKPSYMTKVLKNNGTIKLTISGSTPIMKEHVIKHAINNDKVKNIILELYESYSDRNSTNDNKLPLYLYQKNNFTKFTKYTLNIDIFITSLKLLLKAQPITKNLDDYQSWMSNAEIYFTKFNSCNNLDLLNKTREIYGYLYQDNFPHLDKIIELIQNNKTINFTLFFPPYSRLYYYNMVDKKVNRHLSMRRYLLTHLKDIQNVKIYAFDNFAFTNDLKNYKDERHYHANINKKIVKMFLNEVGLTTQHNIKEYENNFIENLLNYKIYTSSNNCDKYKIKPFNKSQF